MSDLLLSALEGDGINLSFFQFLWNKNDGLSHEAWKVRTWNTVDSKKEKPTYSEDLKHDFDASSNDGKHLDQTDPALAPELRIPDTVIFQYGQPFHWYFTSNKGSSDESDPCKRKRKRIPSILRKRRQNLNMENIERDFLKRCRSDHGGKLDAKRDIVAYFIASKDCTMRRHHSLSDRNRNQDLNDTSAPRRSSSNFDEVKKGNDDSEEHALCDIEYLNAEGLHEFLFNKRSKQSGILQRFLEPAGEGTHNSQIRVIWTPKLCLVERRKCKQCLNDVRFGLYERAVTFDGPDVYSTSIPIRGTILAGELKKICDSLVQQFAHVYTNNIPLDSLNYNHFSIGQGDVPRLSAGKTVARMVVHFKLDSHNRIWLLYSSSIRLIDRFKNFPTMGVSSCVAFGAKSPWREMYEQHADTSSSSPMNIQNIVKLPPTIQLHQNANHNRSVITMSKEISLVLCISCARKESLSNFQNISYKTIVSQYEHAMTMLKNSSNYVVEWQWPPRKEFIKAAGDVGFGPLWMTLPDRPVENKAREYFSSGGNRFESKCQVISEEDLVIPPMIRHLHPRLRVDGYRRYHGDPHFLHKTCPVCERCFLSFANLVTSSFQMTRPVIL